MLGGWLTVAALVADPVAYAFWGALHPNVTLGLISGFVLLWPWKAIAGLATVAVPEASPPA